jgi:hypothetical protein
MKSGKKKQFKGNAQDVARTVINSSTVEEKGKVEAAGGNRQKKLDKLAKRKK